MIKSLLILLIKAYQKFISPLLPPSCIYRPTCSTYMIRAIQRHGALKGCVMGVGRLLRCHPYIQGGYDEVPDYFTVRRNSNSNQWKGMGLKEWLANEDSDSLL